MAYYSRTIKDRVAVGDDCFYMEHLPDGRIKLIPAPDNVSEPGTDINRELLQLIEDRVVLIMNRLFDDIITNPFNITFSSLDGVVVTDTVGVEVTGVWNAEAGRLEC